MRILDRFTNYHSRYGYPLFEAFVAESWWRIEHIPSRKDREGYYVDDGWLRGAIRSYAYRQRKNWERRGFAKGTGVPGR